MGRCSARDEAVDAGQVMEGGVVVGRQDGAFGRNGRCRDDEVERSSWSAAAVDTGEASSVDFGRGKVVGLDGEGLQDFGQGRPGRPRSNGGGPGR